MTLKKIITKKRFLFLDRDGVINIRKVDDYITKWEDYKFLPGVLDAFEIFANYFEKIIIITNQQGIGKKLMSESDLELIHHKLKEKVSNNNGRIDAIFHCPMLKDTPNNCRKPNTKMALKVQELFPEIKFEECIMVGDTASDMEFGRNAGMTRVLLENEHTSEKDRKWSEYSLKSLLELSEIIKNNTF